MRYFLSLLLFVAGTAISFAQEKTIILTEGSLPYTEQQWFSSASFPADKVKDGWDKGKRIHAAAYTANGWFLSMAKGTGYTKQTYSNPSSWPEKWIDDNWNDGYRITDLAYGDGKWLVIMSQNSGITRQSYNSSSSWNNLSTWIKEKRKEGYMITSLTYTGTSWTVVLSQNSQYKSQGYLFASTSDELLSKIKSDVWGRDYSIHKIEYGPNEYIVVYGKYVSNTDRAQNYWAGSSDPKEYISKRWSESKKIAYLGGGSAGTKSNNYVASNNQQNNNQQNNNNNSKDFRVDMGNGDYIDYHWGDDGKLYTTTVRQCIWCHGTLVCGICFGLGGRYGRAYGGMWYPCTACYGKGRCTHCNGEGHTVAYGVADSNGNGYLVSSDGYTAQSFGGGTVVTSPNGKVSVYGGGSGDSDSGYRESSTGSSRIQCPKCNGRKYQLEPIKYAPASAAGWMPPYHTTGGSCPYCSRKDDHYHCPCTECFGYGHVKR